MELVIREQPMRRISGSAEIIMPAGQRLNVRYGTVADPVDEVLEQVPAGKQWKVLVTIIIEETTV